MVLQWIEEVLDLLSRVSPVVLILSIPIGLLWCFFGYRLFKVILGILGFILGGLAGATTAYGAFGGNTLATIVGGLIGGVVGAALLVVLFFLGVFLIGATLGALLALAFSAMIDVQPNSIAILVLAVIGGVLALIVQKFVIIVSTSFSGAWSTVSGIFALAGADVGLFGFLRAPRHTTETFYIMLGLAFLLGVAGVVVQYSVTGRKKKALAPPQQVVVVNPPPPPRY